MFSFGVHMILVMALFAVLPINPVNAMEKMGDCEIDQGGEKIVIRFSLRSFDALEDRQGMSR